MKKINVKMMSLATGSLLALALLGGCGAFDTDQQDSTGNTAVGTILLSVNPEIEVEYDDGGLVLEIEGINEDGKSVVTNYKDYEGKACRTVVNELVQEIYTAGYFSETVDGHAKNIVVKLEEGSSYPGDDFLEDVAEGARDAVQLCNIGSSALIISEIDLDETGRITQEKAKELAMTQLGLSSASFNNHEYELDDGVYEFEFTANGVEYEYEVDAVTGKVLEADFEGNDDWDDRDSWDNWDDIDDQDDDQDDIDDQDD